MDNHLTIEDHVIVALRRITRAADIHSHLLQRDFGVTGPQLSTLRVIHRMQPVPTGALARAAVIGYATLTGILDRLEEHGYVTRTRDPADRRTVILNMTKQGERLLASAPSLLQTRLRDELNRMPPDERTTVLDSLLRVASLMEAEKLDANEEPGMRTAEREAGSAD
ncbi:MAG: MarR family winged helix-turn-helix transcriptional regulator [Deltaproteobacteria bacterium]